MLLPKLTHHHIANGDDQDAVLEEMKLKCLESIYEESKQKETTDGTEDIKRHCPRVWDGILCWGETAAGETATLPCPDYVAGFDDKAEATRQCLQSGYWFFRPEDGNATWTNYSQCSPSPYADLIITYPQLEANGTLVASLKENAQLRVCLVGRKRMKTSKIKYLQQWIPVIKTISRIGYSMSLITLLIAFLIMVSMKKLRCPRNILHMHLFASFIMRAFMSLLKDSLFIDGIGLSNDVVKQNGEAFVLSEGGHSWECKMVISLWQFFIMANYSWVLMEGLYLHNLIFLALFSDTSSITMHVFLGWGIPAVVVMPWIILRAVLEDTLCWTTNDNPLFFLVIRIPIVLSILINFGLFLNIIRVVFLKLQSSVSEETRRSRFKRWAKSTLVLVPLFGVHYTLFLGMSYSIGINQIVEIIWLFGDQFFASFQGLFVAILYCFMNGEVRAELTKTWIRFCKSIKRKGGKAHWLASSDESEGNNIPSNGAGSILFMFPQCGRKLHSAASKGKRVGFDGIESGAESDDKNNSDAKSRNGGTKHPSFDMIRLPRFGRQMSAPAGYMDSDAKISLRGGWVREGKGGKGSGIIAKALGQNDLIKSTKSMAKKKRLFGRSGKTDPGSPFTSTSGCTTHFSEDCRGENSEIDNDDDYVWTSTQNGGSSSPLLRQKGVDSHGKSLQRSMSAGAALRMDNHDNFSENLKADAEDDVFEEELQYPRVENFVHKYLQK